MSITALSSGATAYNVGKPGNAKHDESKDKPYPRLPELLTMQNGTRVTTPAQWTNDERRSGRP